MADSPDREDKTEAPTEKRLREAREKGDVLQSKELGVALVMLAGAGWLALAGPWFVSTMADMLARGLSFDRADIAGFDPAGVALRLMMMVAAPFAALVGMTLLAAIGGPAVLGSLGFRWEALAFKPDRINPASGLGRIFGRQGLIELGKAMAKVVLIGAVAWWVLHGEMQAMLGTSRQTIGQALASTGHMFVLAAMTLALSLVAIAGIDVPAQLIQRSARLRMTKQEVKDEHKQTEGSPEMKMARRRRARELLRGSARTAVTEASVILVNPTHFAVALRYKPGLDVAPIVTARGRGATAQAMRELAAEAEVPVLSYPQLTRAIYYTAQVGQMVREDLYLAVATVLAFVFNLDKALAQGRRQPDVDVPVDARFDENGRRGA